MHLCKKFDDLIFQKRFEDQYDELYKLYTDLYHNNSKFDLLVDMIYEFHQKRSTKLKTLDESRLKTPHWYCKNDSIVIQLYIEKFSGTIKGIEEKLDYLQKLGIKYIYALPFFRSPPGKSDGGFAWSDFRNIRDDLGTINDLEHLINSLHERGMCFIMDCVITNTSDEHEWALKAKKGDIEYQKRFYFYDNWRIPNKFDSYDDMSRYFGDIAYDNFTFVPECKKIVMTTYYPYQWDLNFKNPTVFHEIISNILFLTNLGVDILIFDGAENLWKKAGTNCLSLVPSYVICQIIHLIMKIVCPGVEPSFNLKRHKKKKEKNDNISIDSFESENEMKFVFNESGILLTNDDDDDDIKLSNKNVLKSIFYMDEEEDDIDIDFDITREIGNIHKNEEWMTRLWGSLAMCDVNSIIYSINSISNCFKGECQMTKVHTHDDLNWNKGFGVEKNSFIGNGIGIDDNYRGGILTLYRYLNDYYLGNMPGSFSKGELFAESMITGKARICGSTASLLGLEKSLIEVQKLMKKSKEKKVKLFSQKFERAKNHIQLSINRILLLHAVTGSMPSMFFIYYGDEVGKLNDYSYKKIEDISHDARYLHRGKINWDLVKLVDDDENSYQSKIFNGIKNMINARINCPFFTESEKTVFIKSYSNNEYYELKGKNEVNKNSKTKIEVDNSILIFKRIRKDEKFILFVFNFCEYKKEVKINESDVKGQFVELITGKIYQQINNFKIDGYGYLWLNPIEY